MDKQNVTFGELQHFLREQQKVCSHYITYLGNSFGISPYTLPQPLASVVPWVSGEPPNKWPLPSVVQSPSYTVPGTEVVLKDSSSSPYSIELCRVVYGCPWILKLYDLFSVFVYLFPRTSGVKMLVMSLGWYGTLSGHLAV